MDGVDDEFGWGRRRPMRRMRRRRPVRSAMHRRFAVFGAEPGADLVAEAQAQVEQLVDELGFDPGDGDEFGGFRSRRKKRVARRKARRRKIGRGLRKGFKKIGGGLRKAFKPLAKVLKSKVVKKIIGIIPVYGDAIVAAIEAGEAIADGVRKAIDVVSDVEDKISDAVKKGAPPAVIGELKKQGEAAAKIAEVEVQKLVAIKEAEWEKKYGAQRRAMLARQASDAEKAKAALAVLAATQAAATDPSKKPQLRAAKRHAMSLGLKEKDLDFSGAVERAAEKKVAPVKQAAVPIVAAALASPRVKVELAKRAARKARKSKKAATVSVPRGKVVVLTGKRRFVFDKKAMRRKLRK